MKRMKETYPYSVRNWARSLSLLASVPYLGLGLSAQEDQEDEVFELSPFTVSSSEETGYYTNETLAGGRLRTQLTDVASSVQVMTQEFLEDVGANNMDEVLLYATNADAVGRSSDYVEAGTSSDLTLDNSASRENPQAANNIRGLGRATRTVDYFESEIPFDSYISGRVDINRGANSFLFGLGTPGGIVNRTTNRAELNRDSTKIEVGFSTENFENNYSTRASINHNHVLIEDKLAVRVAAMFDDQEYLQQPAGQDTERTFAAFSYKPFEDRKITLRANYERGNIVSNPANRLGPLENLSTFLSDPTGTVWPKTEENPAGRMLVDGYNEILGFDGSTNKNHRFWGVDDNGDYINYDSSPSSVPAGRGWVAVYDGSQTADGLPTRAFQMNTGGQWVKGNPVFDPDSNYSKGNKDVVFSGSISLKEVGGEYANYSDVGLLNYDVFDWRTQLISGALDYTDTDFDRKNVSLEMISDNGNFGIELGFDKQSYNRESVISIGNPRLAIDVNKTLPVGPNVLFGEINPNFGRPYIITETVTRKTIPSNREALRATGFARFDFAEKFDGFGRWFGDHTVSGLIDKNTSNAASYQSVMTTNGGDVEFHLDDNGVMSNNRRTKSIIYLGPQQLDAWSNPDFALADFDITAVPGNFGIADATPGHDTQIAFWNVGDPVNDENRDSVIGDEYADVGTFNYVMNDRNGSLEETVIESWAINLQSFFLGNHLVANLGWRGDDVSQRLNASPPQQDNGIAYLSPDVFNLDDTEARLSDATNFAYGLVLKTPKSWMPEGHSLSFHYGDSSNFIPNPVGYNMDGILTPATSGNTIDMGVTYSNAKFSVRFNMYEGSARNLTDHSSSGANGVLLSQLGMNTLKAATLEMDRWDWDRNGQFDDPTADDGFDADLVTPLGVAGDGIVDEYTEDNVFTLGQLHQFLDAWEGLVTPFMRDVTRYEFTPSSAPGANDASVSFGNDLYTVFTDTYDLEAEGKELELTFNPTRNWRIMFNATQQSSARSNAFLRTHDFGLRVAETLDMVDTRVAEDGTLVEAGALRYGASSKYLTQIPRTDKWASNALYGRYFSNARGAQLYLYNLALDGTDDPKVREYRFNFVTNYKFTEGALKGLNIGGGYRYQDEAALGFALIEDPETGVPYPDPTRPYYDDAREYVDVWAGYSRKIFNDKVNWKIQLNVRNLFADKDPIVAQYQPDGSWARASVPTARLFKLSNSFSF